MLSAPGRLFVIGVDHRSAPLGLRERLTLPEAERIGFLLSLELDEGCMIATCDRVELVGSATDESMARRAFQRLFALTGADSGGSQPRLLWQDQACAHLAAVAGSLESQVVGEPHVLGQLRAADRLATEAGTMGPQLRAAFDAAYRAAKRVRHETEIAQNPVTLATAGLRAAAELHGDLRRASLLLLGAGEMGEYMAEQFRNSGVERITVAARIEAQARAIAGRLGGHYGRLDERDALLDRADIVVSAVGSGRIVFDAPGVQASLKRRRQRPILFIDAAQPADVAIEVGRIDQAYLFTLDDLELAALKGRAGREAALAPARAIVEEEVAAYLRRLEQRRAAPTVTELRRHFEAMRREALAEAGADAERATELLVQRLLHHPSIVLRECAATDSDAAALVRRLFGIAEAGDAGDGGEPESGRQNQGRQDQGREETGQ